MSASSPQQIVDEKSEPSLANEERESSHADDASESSSFADEACESSSPFADEGDESSSTDERPIRYIIQNLERAYGVPKNTRRSDPLDMLIEIILSQATSDTNSRRTFAALKRRFPTWDAALRARESTIARTIQSGGLANQKAAVIKSLLRQIRQERGALDLGFLHTLPPDEAVRYLSQFRGIGPKTIACTLLFACHTEVFPLDTHIFRILRRVGLIPQKCTDRRAHEIMNAIVPHGKFYSFHVNLIRHGRALCRPRDPLCERCPIVEYCDYGQTLV